MNLTIRDFRPEDAEAAAAAYSAGRPHLLMTPEAVRWRVGAAAPDQHYRLLVAELDGRVVGTARCMVHADASVKGQGGINVSVLPEYRGRGAGGALVRAAEQHLTAHGVNRIHSWVDDEPAARRFAADRGYRAGRSLYFARLDLTSGLPPVPALPPGVELRTADDYLDDPRPLYLLDIEGSRDEPGDLDAADRGYQEWLADTWDHPDLDRGLTTVAVLDGREAALVAAETDGAHRYWSAFTTTGARYRGRGLAKLAKAHSLHLARAAGCTDAYTSNDTTNAPMLAVNAWLGYERCAREWKYIREL
ncbi:MULTISPECIES: GNAT family N-acetyltransferase [Kitasatospora]|uniref:GNAT family N-acetyltransferase n=1 Tax=Kitasatospora cystarginea TaxID=58350 RepID=A0ABP5QHE5_9ACTN